MSPTRRYRVSLNIHSNIIAYDLAERDAASKMCKRRAHIYPGKDQLAEVGQQAKRISRTLYHLARVDTRGCLDLVCSPSAGGSPASIHGSRLQAGIAQSVRLSRAAYIKCNGVAFLVAFARSFPTPTSHPVSTSFLPAVSFRLFKGCTYDGGRLNPPRYRVRKIERRQFYICDSLNNI